MIVGDVPFRDAFAKKIKAISQTSKRIIMTGYVNESEILAELYHHCYAYLHGMNSEAPILHAQGNGLWLCHSGFENAFQ